MTQYLFFSFQIKCFLGCLEITAAWFYFSISFPDSHHSIFITALVYSSLHRLQRQLSMYWTGLVVFLVFLFLFFLSFLCCFFLFFPDRTSRVCDKNRHYRRFKWDDSSNYFKKVSLAWNCSTFTGAVELRLWATSARFVVFVVLFTRQYVMIYY